VGWRCGDMGRRFAISVVTLTLYIPPRFCRLQLPRRINHSTHRVSAIIQASIKSPGTRTEKKIKETRCLGEDEPRQSHKTIMDNVAEDRTSVKKTLCDRNTSAAYTT
jgi:hypothetical protein